MSETRLASRSDIEACSTVLARAFQDDPGSTVIEPNDAARAAFLPAFFRAFAGASLMDGGDLVVPVGDVRGVASWFGPGLYGPRIESLLASGFGDALAILGDAGTQRLTDLVGALDAEHDRLTAGREHLRLEFFGVVPEVQGQGIGGRLIDVGHRRAEELRVPCYLETFTMQNVRFYEHRGYGLVREFRVGDDVPVYAMERPAGGS